MYIFTCWYITASWCICSHTPDSNNLLLTCATAMLASAFDSKYGGAVRLWVPGLSVVWLICPDLYVCKDVSRQICMRIFWVLCKWILCNWVYCVFRGAVSQLSFHLEESSVRLNFFSCIAPLWQGFLRPQRMNDWFDSSIQTQAQLSLLCRAPCKYNFLVAAGTRTARLDTISAEHWPLCLCDTVLPF